MESDFKKDLRLDLMADSLAQMIGSYLRYSTFDVNTLINSTAVQVLTEIHEVLEQPDLPDFEAVDMIVCIFNKYNLDSGRIHELLD